MAQDLPQSGAAIALDFSQVSALIVDGDHYAVETLSQILRGFKLKSMTVAENGEAAKKSLGPTKFDLAIVEAVLPDMKGADLVLWIRRHEENGVRYMPTVILTGHTVRAHVEAARNSGANFILKKPVAASILFDRLAWSARMNRPFVETPAYVGPDRRFKNLGPPDGVGRRSSDLTAEIGDASEPNLSQSEIDAFVKPVKIKLD